MDYRHPPLFSKKDTQNFDASVFAMVAENDVFFPKEKAISRMQNVFSDLREVYVLKDAKHIPDISRYDKIVDKIEKWLSNSSEKIN